jgi:P-type conjugative transfer protein TrbJ
MTAIAVLSLMPVSGAEAGVLAGGASEFTQILNKVELIVQTQKMAQQVMQAKKTVELLKNNFERLGSGGWGMFSGVLNTLADSVTHGERTAFALAQADEEFERRYAQKTGNEERPARFSQAYMGWWQKNRAMVQKVLGKVGMKARDFKNQRAGIAKLQSLSRSPGSRDQILQASNELAVAQAVQLQELQQIGMQQIALQGNAFTAEQEQVHHKREAMRRALRTPRLYSGKEKKY